MKVYLILGASGTIARYFVRKLDDEESEVHAISSLGGTMPSYTLDGISQALLLSKPDVVINFAGSFSEDFDTSYRANVLVSKNLLDAAVGIGYMGKVVLVGSAAEYGSEARKDEAVVGFPTSIYGLTKLMQRDVFAYYSHRFDLNANYIRLFNIVDADMNDRLFIGNLSRQLRLVLQGETDAIQLGNLKSYRDLLLLRDAFSGFMQVIKHGERGEIYNLATGYGILLEDFVKKVLSILGLDPALVSIDKGRESVGRVDNGVGASVSKMIALGWCAQADDADSIALEYCNQIRQKKPDKML